MIASNQADEKIKAEEEPAEEEPVEVDPEEIESEEDPTELELSDADDLETESQLYESIVRDLLEYSK